MERSFTSRNWTNADTLAKIFGGIFLVAGVLGFIPNPLISARGLFEVNTFHNIVHMITGGVLLASPYYNAPVVTLRAVGVIYALVTLLGFISLGSLESMGMAVNAPDNWLHLLLSGAMLWAGFTLPETDRDRITTAHM